MGGLPLRRGRPPRVTVPDVSTPERSHTTGQKKEEGRRGMRQAGQAGRRQEGDEEEEDIVRTDPTRLNISWVISPGRTDVTGVCLL